MTTRNAASMGAHGSSWQTNGYAGNGNVHDLIGSLKGRVAIVCGGGDGVFDQLVSVKFWYPNTELVIFAANDVGMFLPWVDHWVSLHSYNLGPWKQVRWLHPIGDNTKYHAIEAYPFIDYVWSGLTPLFALSGYFAMQIAYIMGASRIILAGCPGDGTKRFFDTTARADFMYGDKGVQEQLEKEMDRLPDFKSRVRSMSGFTKEYFGGIV